MGISLFGSKKRVVSLVINDHSIRYVELKQTKPPIVQKWGERYLPPGIVQAGKIIDHDSLSGILEECIDKWKIKKLRVRFLVPDPFVIIRKITIPTDVAEDEINGYIYLEMGSSIHLPFEEPVFDTIILSEDKAKKDLLLFAAEEQNVTGYAELFSEVKLVPVAADISPLALYRLYFHLGQAKRDDRLLIVQFDLKTVNLSIFEGKIPFLMHQFPLEFDENKWDYRLNRSGKQIFTFTGERKEQLSRFEDCYKEINKLMDFYRYSLQHGKQGISKLLVSGDHPMLLEMITEMKKRFDVTVETMDAEHVSSVKEGALPKTHYLALGLALKEV